MIELAFQIALLIILVPIALIVILAVGGGVLALVGAFLWSITFGLFKDQKEFIESKQGVYGLIDSQKKTKPKTQTGERLTPSKKDAKFFGPFIITREHSENNKYD